MHRPQTHPPAAPPVVPPPLPEELLPPPPPSPGPVAIFVKRLVRDCKIGAVCLVIGLLVGHSGWLDRRDQAPPTTASIGNDSVQVAQRSMLDSAGDAVPTETTLNETVPGKAMLAEVVPAESMLAESTLAEPIVPVDDVQLIDAIEVVQRVASDNGVITDTLPTDDSQLTQTRVEERVAATPPGDPVTTDGVETFPASETQQFAESSPPQPQTPRSLMAAGHESSVGSSIESLMTLTTSQSSTMHPEVIDETCQGMESHGTLLKWADSPADAYRIANEKNKLVFMIHVSGNFEIPGFT